MSATFSVVVATLPGLFRHLGGLRYVPEQQQPGCPGRRLELVCRGLSRAPPAMSAPGSRDGKSWHWWGCDLRKYVPIDARIPSPYTVSVTRARGPRRRSERHPSTPPRLWLQIDASGHIVDWHFTGAGRRGSFFYSGHRSLRAWRDLPQTDLDQDGRQRYPVGQYRWNPTTSVWVNMDTFWVQPFVPGPLPVTRTPSRNPSSYRDERKEALAQARRQRLSDRLFLYDPTFQRWRDARHVRVPVSTNDELRGRIRLGSGRPRIGRPRISTSTTRSRTTGSWPR